MKITSEGVKYKSVKDEIYGQCEGCAFLVDECCSATNKPNHEREIFLKCGGKQSIIWKEVTKKPSKKELQSRIDNLIIDNDAFLDDITLLVFEISALDKKIKGYKKRESKILKLINGEK